MKTLTTRLFLLALLSVTVQAVFAQVTPERLLNAEDEPTNWLLYGGDYDSQRHTELDQITKANVAELELQWVWQVRGRDGAAEKFESTPLVVDGVMYTVAPPNTVVAIDPKTGR